MGSLLLDYLLDSPLFESGRAEDLFTGFSDKDILRHLRDYRDFILTNIDTLHQEVQHDSSSLKIMAPQDEVDIDLLRNLSLYVQQFLLEDPLFPFTVEPTSADYATGKLLGWREHSLNRRSLAKAINYLRLLQPFVAANYIKILPFSRLRERPAEVPIFFDADNFSNALPEDIMKFMQEHAIVESMVKVEGGGWRTNEVLHPCRSIYVTFKGLRTAGGMIFQLTDQEVTGVSEESRTAEILVTFPESPPDPDLFETWTKHSINRAAINHVRELMTHNMLAAEHRSAYLTDSSFSFNLLQRSVHIQPSIPVETVNQLLRLDLPYLENISSGDLMKIRLEEGEAFESFRRALEKGLREVRLEKDPEVANLLAENALHELFEVQVQEVSRKVGQLKTRFFIDASLLAGSLVAAVQAGGWGIPAIALAAAEGYRTYKEYQQNVRENPAFFLWRVKGQAAD